MSLYEAKKQYGLRRFVDMYLFAALVVKELEDTSKVKEWLHRWYFTRHRKEIINHEICQYFHEGAE